MRQTCRHRARRTYEHRYYFPRRNGRLEGNGFVVPFHSDAWNNLSWFVRVLYGYGLLVAKLMCKLTHGQINPLIGSAGVSAVPMAARISQDVGRESDPDNHLLMHAMGPNVAGVIGSAIAAGVLLALFG